MSENEQIPLAVCLERAVAPLPALVPIELPERPITFDVTPEQRAEISKVREATRSAADAIRRNRQANEKTLPTRRISDAIRAATPEQLGLLLEARVVADHDIVMALTELRADPPELLARWIERCTKTSVQIALAVVAADRFLARGDAVPESFDAILIQHVLDEGAPFALFGRVLERLPRERVTRFFHALAAFIAPRRDPDRRTTELAECIAALPFALTRPWLLGLMESSRGEARAYWEQVLLCVFAGAAAREETWPPELDVHLHFGPYFEGGWKTDANLESMRRILSRLPLDRAKPIFDRAFAQRPSLALNTFVAIAAHPVESVVRPAFALLTADTIRFVRGDARTVTHIRDAVRDLGDDGRRWARWVLDHRRRSHADVSEALRPFLDDTFWADYHRRFPPDGQDDEPDPAIEDLATLEDTLRERAGATESTAIYALLRTAGLDDTYNQIGGVPRGFTPFNWPKRFWRPLQFICMIDLATLPTIRAGSARGLALFASNGHSRVISLTEDQLQQPGSAPKGVDSLALAGISVTELVIPMLSLSADLEQVDDDNEDHVDEQVIRDQVMRLPARAGGTPSWIEEIDRSDDDFILQFDESFVPELDLGDKGGLVFLFRDAAEWQFFDE